MAQQTISPADTYIFAGAPTDNYSAQTFVGVGNAPPSLGLRGLWRFDMSALPPGASVLDTSSLALYVNTWAGVGPGAMTGYIITKKDWVAAQATWNNYKTGTAWGTAGGDFDVPSIAIADPGAAPSTVSITGADFKTMLDYAIANDSEILHLLIKANVETGAFLFFSSQENATPSQRPLLTVNYDPRKRSTFDYSSHRPVGGAKVHNFAYWGD